jgi:DNA-binding transcriptional ArsR family regulator
MSDVEPVNTPNGRDYELDDAVVADTPERMKALGDPLRLTITDLVMERAMSVTELASRLDRPKGSVAHHVKVLVDAGLLKVVRTRKVRATEERFYGRVGRTIVFPHGPDGGVPFLDDVAREIDLDRCNDESMAFASGFTFRHARIPKDRADEYVDRLYALSLEFIDEPRAGDTEYGMYVALFPTNRRVADRDNKER